MFRKDRVKPQNLGYAIQGSEAEMAEVRDRLTSAAAASGREPGDMARFLLTVALDEWQAVVVGDDPFEIDCDCCREDPPTLPASLAPPAPNDP